MTNLLDIKQQNVYDWLFYVEFLEMVCRLALIGKDLSSSDLVIEEAVYDVLVQLWQIYNPIDLAAFPEFVHLTAEEESD